MRCFSKKDIEMMGMLVSPELALRCAGVKKRMESGKHVTIANTGLFSSGKSSLFNVLLGKVDEERFPVGATPTTKKGDREALDEFIEIIDTPGIDATDEDDSVALNMLMESDIIIMTHNVSMGPLNRSEELWLRNITSKMKTEDIAKRLIFVATFIDKIDNKEDCTKVTDEIKNRIKDIAGQDVPFFEVSSTRYCNALIKNKKPMEIASNIPQFKEYLLSRAHECADELEALHNGEMLLVCSELKKQLESLKASNMAECERQEKRIGEIYRLKSNNWKGKLYCFSEKRADVEAKLEELKSEWGSEINALIGSMSYILAAPVSRNHAGYESYSDFETKIKNI